MPGKAVGRSAVDLPWFCPHTNSLVGLAEDPARLSRLAPADPGLFTFLCRFALAETSSPFTPPHERLVSSALPETAAAYLDATTLGWLDPESLRVQTVNAVAECSARIARSLAEQTQRAFPEAAETAARLAMLGWYAVLACDESAAAACLQDTDFDANPSATQESHWGLDHDAIARRLVGRWKLPTWLGSLVGCLNLPFEAAAHLGADVDLFAVVSLAVHAAQEQTTNLGLTHECEREKLLTHLGIAEESLVEYVLQAPVTYASGSSVDQNPHRVPLVANLLRAAGLARRRNGAALVVRLEERIDELHRSAASLAELAGNRLHDAKLVSLAEFAAGAGHEINNPLAVISGNAQRLLRTEQDDDRAESLRSVVRQAQRISGILRELMHFARPPKAELESVLVLNLANAVCNELMPLAEERGVRLELSNAAPDSRLYVDAKQLRSALTAVIRNGIEAATLGGWVRLECTRHEDSLHFAVEDSGPGLTRDVAAHAFDPFYSGRAAGRGRGLGLSTAWRLANQNGGEIHFEPTDGPTRFVFTFPLAAPQASIAERRSA